MEKPRNTESVAKPNPLRTGPFDFLSKDTTKGPPNGKRPFVRMGKLSAVFAAQGATSAFADGSEWFPSWPSEPLRWFWLFP